MWGHWQAELSLFCKMVSKGTARRVGASRLRRGNQNNVRAGRRAHEAKGRYLHIGSGYRECKRRRHRSEDKSYSSDNLFVSVDRPYKFAQTSISVYSFVLISIPIRLYSTLSRMMMICPLRSTLRAAGVAAGTRSVDVSEQGQPDFASSSNER